MGASTHDGTAAEPPHLAAGQNQPAAESTADDGEKTRALAAGHTPDDAPVGAEATHPTECLDPTRPLEPAPPAEANNATDNEPTVALAAHLGTQNSHMYPPVLLAPPAQPFAAGLRRALAVMLGVLAIVTALAGAGGKWADAHLVSARGFTDLSAQLADDTDVQQRIAAAAVDDLMNSEGLTQYLERNGLLTWLFSYNRDSVRTALNGAAQKVTTTGEYKKLWRQVAADTHTHLISDENAPAALDVSALYRELDSAVGTIGPLDPDITAWGNRYISLENGDNNAVHHKIMQFKAFANAADAFLIASLVTLLAAVLLWPRGRYLFAACLLLAGALTAWGASLYLDTVNAASLGINPSYEVGRAYIDGLLDAVKPAAVADARGAASYTLIAALITLLVGVLAKLSRLTASTTTVPTH